MLQHGTPTWRSLDFAISLRRNVRAVLFLTLACVCFAQRSATAAQPSGDDKKTIAKLSQEIGNRDEGKAAAALIELSQRGVQGVDPLLRATKDARKWVRNGAWSGLAEIGKPALRVLPAIVTAACASTDQNPDWIELALAVFDSSVELVQGGLHLRAFSAQLGGEIGKDVAGLDDMVARYAPLRALVLVGGHDLPKMLQLMTECPPPKDDSVSDLEVAFAAAARLNRAEALPLLQQEIKSKDARRLRFALIAGSALGDDASPLVADMCALLTDESPGTQRRALEALCALAIPSGPWQARLDELCASPDARVRLSAARAVIYCSKKGELAVPLLLALSEDPNVIVRRWSLGELWSLTSSARGKFRTDAPTGVRPAGVVERLLPRLKDTDVAVVNQTIDTLGNFGPNAKATVPALKTLAASGHESTRPLAKKALELIDK